MALSVPTFVLFKRLFVRGLRERHIIICTGVVAELHREKIMFVNAEQDYLDMTY